MPPGVVHFLRIILFAIYILGYSMRMQPFDCCFEELENVLAAGVGKDDNLEQHNSDGLKS